jgi:hypothetical protein
MIDRSKYEQGIDLYALPLPSRPPPEPLRNYKPRRAIRALARPREINRCSGGCAREPTPPSWTRGGQGRHGRLIRQQPLVQFSGADLGSVPLLGPAPRRGTRP